MMLPNVVNIIKRALVEIFQVLNEFRQEFVRPFPDTIRAVIDEPDGHRRSPMGIV